MKRRSAGPDVDSGKTHYAISTLLFGVVGAAAVFGIVHFGTTKQWFLTGTCVLAFLIALDNFFCGSHARAAGYYVKTHWIVPPFLKRK